MLGSSFHSSYTTWDIREHWEEATTSSQNQVQGIRLTFPAETVKNKEVYVGGRNDTQDIRYQAIKEIHERWGTNKECTIIGLAYDLENV